MAQERENKLQQTRRQLEYDELKDCTFQPDILQRPATTAAGGGGSGAGSGGGGGEPVVVRGLGRYMELKEMAKRLEAAKRYETHAHKPARRERGVSFLLTQESHPCLCVYQRA